MEIVALFIAFLAFWYIFQKIVQVFLLRKATAFCPQCFSAYLQPASRPVWAGLFPYIPISQCHDCGLRFLRGRKPPFAICPNCRGAALESLPADSNPGIWRGTIRRIVAPRNYGCRKCEIRFFDRRPTREELAVNQRG